MPRSPQVKREVRSVIGSECLSAGTPGPVTCLWQWGSSPSRLTGEKKLKKSPWTGYSHAWYKSRLLKYWKFFVVEEHRVNFSLSPGKLPSAQLTVADQKVYCWTSVGMPIWPHTSLKISSTSVIQNEAKNVHPSSLPQSPRCPVTMTSAFSGLCRDGGRGQRSRWVSCLPHFPSPAAQSSHCWGLLRLCLSLLFYCFSHIRTHQAHNLL